MSADAPTTGRPALLMFFLTGYDAAARRVRKSVGNALQNGAINSERQIHRNGAMRQGASGRMWGSQTIWPEPSVSRVYCHCHSHRSRTCHLERLQSHGIEGEAPTPNLIFLGESGMKSGEILTFCYSLMAIGTAISLAGAFAGNDLTQRYELAGGLTILILSFGSIFFLNSKVGGA